MSPARRIVLLLAVALLALGAPSAALGAASHSKRVTSAKAKARAKAKAKARAKARARAKAKRRVSAKRTVLVCRAAKPPRKGRVCFASSDRRTTPGTGGSTTSSPGTPSRTSGGGGSSTTPAKQGTTGTPTTTAPKPSTPPASTPVADDAGLRLGLVANSQGRGRLDLIGEQQDRVKATGAGWIREELQWSVVEPSDGDWRWQRYDDLFTAAAQRGLQVLVLLNDAPSWTGAQDNAVPRDTAAFADLVTHVVARYGPGGSFWAAHPELPATPARWFEVWNEAYYPPGGYDGPDYDPGRYARLVRAAAIAGRAVSPDVRFLADLEVTGRQEGDRWVHWADAIYEAMPNLNDYVDGFAVHPYGEDMTGFRSPGFGQFRRIEELREKVVAHGGAAKPFWATELGWSTCTAGERCVSEAQQAANVTRAVTAFRTTYAPFVRAVFFYHHEDWGPADPAEREYWFGLTRRDGSHKPAWDALRAAAGVAG